MPLARKFNLTGNLNIKLKTGTMPTDTSRNRPRYAQRGTDFLLRPAAGRLATATHRQPPMTTATQSEPSRSDAPRRRPQVDGLGDYPVLIRLPNLEADAGQREANTTETPAGDEKFATSEAAVTNHVAPPTPGDVQPNSMPMRADKGAFWASPPVMGWVWKGVIIAAAIGLVVLAYKIINGPGSAVAPVDVDTVAPAADTPAPMPEIKDVTAQAIESIAPTGPAVANPAPTANYVDQKGYHETNFDPHGHDEHVPTYSTGRAAATAPLTPKDGTLPIGPTEDRPGEWETESPATTPNPNMQSRPWNETPGGQDAASRPWAMPAEQNPRAAATDNWSGGEYNYESTSPDSYRPAGSQSPQPNPPADNYNYPQTSSDTWRDYPGSNTPPQAGPSRGDGANLPEAWNNGSYSAQRPAWPGTARLRGEIEQPPLR